MATINAHTEAAQLNVTSPAAVAPAKHSLPPAKTVDSQSVAV
ncbi:uncharacterized protein G2W53_016014 [Senna tora]|uniref:Uncharacterized protein n=1 Tax=Senna tora TaxID=362788 RepID=A0A835C6F6_9FABA|nr:uncharacterized protein G2W53_016014 [Senna tora]